MSTNPFLSVDRQIVGDVYTSNELMHNLSVLCDEFGSRFGGTPSERQAAEFMQARLASYGLHNVHLEPIEYVGWRRGVAQCEILSPVHKALPCITLPHSPPAVLEGALVDMGDGAPDDFEARAAEIAGNIVLVTSKTNPKGGRRWIHRLEKYGRALLAGATGFIFVNHYPGLGPVTGGIGPDHGGAAAVPGISLSYEDGAFLQRLIRRHGEARVRISSSDVVEPMVSWNVIADLPGKDRPEEVIMLGCHYDGHDISQGAADPASGTVAVLEAARVLAAYAPNLPRTVRFALWGVEEIGLIGSTQHVARHADALPNLRFYLNMDMAGAIAQKDIVLNEWPALAPLFEQWSQEMALPFRVAQSVNAHSDHYPFLLAGVPTGAIGSAEPDISGRGYGHTQHDTLDKTELRGMREAAVLAARLALRLASANPWPAQQRSPAEVQTLFDNPAYRAEAALQARVRAFYQAPPAG